MGRGNKQTGRDDILRAARKLIIQDGSAGTSMRDIASELGISVGNLTYYYKTKIELMEAVVLDLYEHEGLGPEPKDLFELDALFRNAQRKHSESQHYFRNYARFAASSEKISQAQKALWLTHLERWRGIMQNLCGAGLIQPESYHGQFELFIDSVAFMILYRNSRDEVDGHMGLSAPSLRDSLWSVFFPLLTAQGKRIYIDQIKEEPI